MFSRRFYKQMFIFTVLICTGLFLVPTVFAANDVVNPAGSGLASFAANAGFATGLSIQVIIARLIRTALGTLGVITVVLVLYGGFLYMTAGGNEERVKKAKKILINAVIGLVIVLSAFAITQFILKALVGGEGGGDITVYCKEHPTDPSCVSSDKFPPTSTTFTLKSSKTIIQCASGIRNLVLPFVFSSNVSLDGVNVNEQKGIAISNKNSNTVVNGALALSGRKITFTPKDSCGEPHADLHCFDANTTFHVEVDPLIVKSTSGKTLVCNEESVTVGTQTITINPCSFDFTTGSTIDTEPPSQVAMTYPIKGNGDNAILGMQKLLQAATKDDVGIASLDFLMDDGSEPIASFPTTDTLSSERSFETNDPDWVPSGYQTNKSYPVWAVGSDCAGNTKTSAKVSVVMRAANCGNSAQDAASPYNESGVNCGGDPKSAYYCGACAGAQCTVTADCGPDLFCVNGTCESKPVILSVSPNDGAEGNLITIHGKGFGTETQALKGSVQFPKGVIVSAQACGTQSSWTNTQVVVKVPSGTETGALEINTPDGKSDKTNDAIGPAISSFELNAIKRPGLCSVTPTTGTQNTAFTLNGLGFKASRGSSSVYFTNFPAVYSSAAADWADTIIKATTPNLPAKADPYHIQVFTGDYYCMDASGVIPGAKTVCQTDKDCTDAGLSKCAMKWCSKTLAYCENDGSCGQTGGKCVDVRVGSNSVDFIATQTVTTKPTISAIDSGWKACNAGVNNGKHCTKDADCPMPPPSNTSTICQVVGTNAKKICGNDNTTDCQTDSGCAPGVKCDYMMRFCSISKKLCSIGGGGVACGTGEGTCTLHSKGLSNGADVGFCLQDGPNKMHLCLSENDCTNTISTGCVDQKTWGPSGQYLTIYGSGFGPSTAKGTVQFKNKISGNTVNADTDFPEGCGNTFWNPESITVKVPKKLGADDLPLGDYDLTVVPLSGLPTDAKDFKVVSEKPTPGICGIDPDNGPVGTTFVKLLGENLGKAMGTVKFSSSNAVSPGGWDETMITSAKVETGTTTGPVYVTDGQLNNSNSVNFKVGSCKKDADCTSGKLCCSTGSCQTVCSNIIPVAHFAYKVSTVPIPVAPYVIEKCGKDETTGITTVSPSPSTILSSSNASFCANAAVTATFSKDMDQSTLNNNTIIVQRCKTFANGECKLYDTTPVPAAINGGITKSTNGFSWIPEHDACVNNTCSVTGGNCATVADCPQKDGFAINTTYQVTLKGGQIRAAKIGSADGPALEKDYVWHFTTASTVGLCAVNSLLLTPHDYTTHDADWINQSPPGYSGYLALPLSEKDQCVALDCSPYTLSWSKDFYGVLLDKTTTGSGALACVNRARGSANTPVNPSTPAKITAIITNSSNKTAPSGDAFLTVDFADLKVVDHTPECQEACINTQPTITFNVPIYAPSLAQVTLWKCDTAYCEPGHMSDSGVVASLDGIDTPSNPKKIIVKFGSLGLVTKTLNPNTWYRVEVKNIASSAWDTPLSKAGSNYSGKAPSLTDPNPYFPGEYSWKFKTRNSSDLCKVDKIQISPKVSTLYYVGQRQQLSALAYGAPDACSAVGQVLQSDNLNPSWSAWTATDNPNKSTASANDVASMLSAGSIQLTKNIPAYCTSQCLLSGNAAKAGAGVCGDGITQTSGGEACDDGNKVDGTCAQHASLACSANTDCPDKNEVCNLDGCSSHCLKEGSKATTCGNGNAALDSGEQCDDGNKLNGDGCSSLCLFEGGVAPICGDGTVDQSTKSGGEECDHGPLNGTLGDGCSSKCLLTGSSSALTPSVKCGDGVTQMTSGESCDPGMHCISNTTGAITAACSLTNQTCAAGSTCKTVSYNGCSDVCLRTGTLPVSANLCKSDNTCSVTGGVCSAAVKCPACGNGQWDSGEDVGCDTAAGITAGCSNTCLLMGSGVNYVKPDGKPAIPSFCGDGDPTGVGEQCDDNLGNPKKVGGYGVAEINANASLEVDQDELKPDKTPNPKYGYAISSVKATIGTVQGESTVQLSCSCENDAQCGLTDATPAQSLGCGVAKCCFERPNITTIIPPNSATGVCRNTAISITFDQEMNLSSFGAKDVNNDGTITADEYNPNLQLVVTKIGNAAVTFAATKDKIGATDCPYYAKQTATSDTKNLFVLIWHWIKGLFGHPVMADAISQCFVPVTFEQDPVTHKVFVKYTDALLPNATYELRVNTDANGTDATPQGVLSKNGVGVCIGDNKGACTANHQTVTFTTGADICRLTLVDLKDNGINNPVPPPYQPKSEGYYSKKDESHAFAAQSLTVKNGIPEEIQSTTQYAWGWSWVSPVKDTSTKQDLFLIDPAAPVNTTQAASFKAAGKNGQGDVIAIATITADSLVTPPNLSTGPGVKVCSTDKKKVCSANAECGTGTCTVAAKVCSNNTNKLCTDETVKADCLEQTATCVTKEASSVSGSVVETAFLCENPWPSTSQGVPYIDAGGTATNFSMFYCRDAGDAGRCDGNSDAAKIGKACSQESDCRSKTNTTGACVSYTADDLPALNTPTVSTTASQAISADVLKEYVFNVQGTKDSIGVRVMTNPTYLSPMEWYGAKFPTGGVPKMTTLDGYQAVQTGTTIYVAAANRNGNMYSNIYVISYNTDAGKDAQTIFDLLLQNFRFNANDDATTGVSHVGLCKKNGSYVQDGSTHICSSDLDCENVCNPDGKCSVSQKVCTPGSNDCAADSYGSCDADKQKLARDLKRLTDMKFMVSAFEKYGSTHRHCSVTKNQTCQTDGQCPAQEVCVNGYPTMQSGTFIPSMTNSIWSSWNSTLGNVVGTALPKDPLNQFGGQCSGTAFAGYDSASCWNGKEGKFICPSGSYIYGYQSQGGESYAFQSQLEYTGTEWQYPFTIPSQSHAVVVFSDNSAAGLSGLSLTSKWSGGVYPSTDFCKGSVFGISLVCGDGVVGTGEECEKGMTKSVSCTGGKMNIACKNNCQWQSEADAIAAGSVCKLYNCGNGIVEINEDCDDGSLNGTYGHCGAGCKVATAVSCGDGTLAGTEQCDCGTTNNYTDLTTTKTTSWAYLHKANTCSVANGEYKANGDSCSSDCKIPGPKCGDKIIDAPSEQCDGGTQEYAGLLCADQETKCSTVSTNSSECGGTACGTASTNLAACTKGFICLYGDADKVGKICSSDNNCGTNGKCSAIRHCAGGTKHLAVCSSDAECTGNAKCSPQVEYNLTRSRTCIDPGKANACHWNTGNGKWGDCVGGVQHCGNGIQEWTDTNKNGVWDLGEPGEQCDDGNINNFDNCLNSCELNSCGDGYVNVGIESCDSGVNNKADTATNKCGSQNPPYGGSCNYCTNYCQYKTESGPYCGDGVKNGNEYCDGSDLPLFCVKNGPGGAQDLSVGSPCLLKDKDTQVGCNAAQGEYCRLVGVCNGGTGWDQAKNQISSGENGRPCDNVGGPGAHNYCDGYCNNTAHNQCNGWQDCCKAGTSTAAGTCTSANADTCIGVGSCVMPTCAPNCGSTCPTEFKKVGVQVQSSAPGATPATSIELYSDDNVQNKAPKSAAILLPACRVGSLLSADVSTTAKITNGIVAHVIAESNQVDADHFSNLVTGDTSLLIGNGIYLNLPGGFLCHDTAFKVPLSATFTANDGGTVSFKNLEFLYCPK